MLLAACLVSAGQEDTPTFRSGTTLIEFTVVALDRNGNPVTDLRKEEITIAEHGKPRDVAFFRFEGGGETVKPEPLPPGVFTNRSEYTAGPPRNITAILLDALNTLPSDQKTVREQVSRYLREIEPGARIAVYGLGRELSVIHDFTDDVESLRARMEESLKKFPIQVSPDVLDLECFAAAFGALSPDDGGCGRKVGFFLQQPETAASAESIYYQAAAARRRDLTLASLQALGNQLAGIPGRKSLVWIGGGVPIYSVTGVQRIGDANHGFKSYEEQIRRTAQRLASQGVVIYPVDSRAMARAGGQPKPQTDRRGPANMDIMANVVTNYQPESTNDVLAEVTGGRVVRLTNDLSKGLKLAASDQLGAYTVAFYSAGEPDNKWHGIEVRARRRDVKLSYRQGYLADAPAERPLELSEQQWRAAIMNPVGSTAVHLDARLERIAGAEADAFGLLLQIGSDDLHFQSTGKQREADVEVVTAQKTPSGDYAFRVETVKLSMAEDRAKDVKSLRYRQRLRISPETSTMRIIVRDRYTGRYGALDVPLKNTIPPN